MDDMMAKIQDVLNDEESMNQIKQLAQMLGASGEGMDNQNSSQNQEAQPDLSKIFSVLGGNGQDNQQNNSMPFDINTLMQLQGLFQAASNDKSLDLLIALRPHLKEDKQLKVDKAVKFLKLFALWTAAKESGLLNSIDLFK